MITTKTATKKRKQQVSSNRFNSGLFHRLPYTSRKTLLTAGERRFYTEGLLPAVGNRFHIAPKVRLADVITCKGSVSSIAFRKIMSKHVDFILMYRKSSRIVAAIELNDDTHQKDDRRHRDAFVADALRAAGIPLIMVPVFQTYSPTRLRAHIERAIKRS